MNKLLTAMGLVSTLALAAPAAAQYPYSSNVNARGAVSFDTRVGQLATRLEAGVRSGAISQRDAGSLRAQLSQISQIERQYSRNGLTAAEQADLRQRIQSARMQIRTADRGSYDRYERAGDWAEYDAYGQGQYANQGNGYGSQVSIGTRIGQLQTRLDAGIRSGAIDSREADSLRQQLSDLRRLDSQYSRNGLSQQERMDLQRRVRAVRQQMRTADSGAYDRYERSANWDDDARYDQYGNRIDSDVRYDQYGNRVGSDVRYDQYGNRVYDDGYNGQGGPYEDATVACESRSTGSGIGGILSRVLGGGNDCLRVGERVSGNLGAVPYEYRDQFRDGNGVYYRSDGRVIYQIDARSDTVLRIYNIDR